MCHCRIINTTYWTWRQYPGSTHKPHQTVCNDFESQSFSLFVAFITYVCVSLKCHQSLQQFLLLSAFVSIQRNLIKDSIFLLLKFTHNEPDWLFVQVWNDEYLLHMLEKVVTLQQDFKSFPLPPQFHTGVDKDLSVYVVKYIYIFPFSLYFLYFLIFFSWDFVVSKCNYILKWKIKWMFFFVTYSIKLDFFV